MAPLGALSQAWFTAEASLPLGWRIVGQGCAAMIWRCPSRSLVRPSNRHRRLGLVLPTALQYN